MDYREERKKNPWHWFKCKRPDGGGDVPPPGTIGACGVAAVHLLDGDAQAFLRQCKVARVYAEAADAGPRMCCPACEAMAEAEGDPPLPWTGYQSYGP